MFCLKWQGVLNKVFERFEFVFQPDYTENDLKESPDAIELELSNITRAPERREGRYVIVRAK